MKVLLFLFSMLMIAFPVQNKEKEKLTSEQLAYIKQQYNINKYINFKEQLGFLESSGRYNITNSTGKFLGKYQFGPLALKDIGFSYSTTQFLSSEKLQELALYKYLSLNKQYLSDEINKFVGKTVNGITITLPGLLASAHLAGAGNVKEFLYSNGNNIFADGNGTKLTKYLKIFSKYTFNLHSVKQYVQKQYA